VFKKLFHLLFFGHYKPSDLKKVEASLHAANQRALIIFPALSAAACLSGALGGLFSDIDVMKRCLVGYTIVFAINIAIILVNYHAKKVNRKLQTLLITLFVAPLYLFSLYQAIYITPDDRPLILAVFLCLIPTIFIDSPIRLFIDFIFTGIIFIALAPSMVPANQLGISIADVLIFGTAGVGIGIFFNHSRTERYILAQKIEEMRNESEQMEYWKSVSNIYISMIQADINNDTFIQIRTSKTIHDIVGNTHDNFARQMANVVKETVDPDYLETVLQFVDPSTLQERLGDEETITYEFLEKNYGWCRARYIAVNRQKGEPLKKVMFLVESINEQKKREKLLTTIAETDSMTGLYNRRAGIPKIKKQMGLKVPGMLCLMDVDKFKHINDNYGHQAGDRVIVAVADTLRETLRDEDIILRLGGDEYLFFVSNVDTERVACNIFNRLFDRFEKVSIGSIPDYKISVSIGATFFKEGLTFDEMYSQADSCTYESKKVEGKAFTFYRG